VQAAAEALKTVGCFVEPVRILALERDFGSTCSTASE
jgi:hypothetical protein